MKPREPLEVGQIVTPPRDDKDTQVVVWVNRLWVVLADSKRLNPLPTVHERNSVERYWTRSTMPR